MQVESLPFGQSIGGHAIASICGYNTYEDGSVTDLWEMLTGKRESRFRPSLESEKGHALQPLILKYWAQENDVNYIENVNFADDEYPFLTGHLDAQDVHGNVIEVKTLNFAKARMFGESGTSEIPKNFAIQLMWYMMLTNAPQGTLLAYAMDTTREFVLYRDMSIEKILRERAVSFWKDHVLADIPPKPTTLKEIGRYYSKSNGLSLEADLEIIKYHALLKEVRTASKEAEETEEKLKSILQAYLKENEVLMAEGSVLATWKNSKSSSFDTKSFREKYPELYNEFLRTQEIRRFLIK